MERLNIKLQKMIEDLINFAHGRDRRSLFDVKVILANHLAALEKTVEDQKAEVLRLRKARAELEEHLLEIQNKMGLGYLEDARVHVDAVCALILKERGKRNEDGS